METQWRSIVKSVTWRIIGTVNGITITYLFLPNVKKAIAIGIVANLTGMVLYYFHERFWNKIKWGKHANI